MSNRLSLSSLPEDLKCPVCFDLPNGKVLQCRDGHILCEKCYKRCYSNTRQCPQCRIQLDQEPIRNRMTEEMVARLIWECPFKKHGCSYNTGDENARVNHCEICHFRFGPLKPICKVIGFSDCPFEMNYGNGLDVIDHFKNKHGIKVCDKDNVQIELENFAVYFQKKVNGDTMLTPLLLKWSTEPCAFLLVIRVHPEDNSLSFITFYFPVQPQGHMYALPKVEIALKTTSEDDHFLNINKPICLIKAADQLSPNAYQFRVTTKSLLGEFGDDKLSSIFISVKIGSSGPESKGEETWPLLHDWLVCSPNDLIAVKALKGPKPDSISWVPMSNGSCHEFGVVAGTEVCWDVYVARASHNNSLVPGKFLKHYGQNVAMIADGGEEVKVTSYEVLIAPPGSVKWEYTEKGEPIPSNAIQGGHDPQGHPYYIGRVIHKGLYIPGKIDSNNGYCYIPWWNEHRYSKYEILVRSSENN